MERDPHFPFGQPPHLCVGVTSVSKPFDNHSKREVRLDVSRCHGIKGGQIYLQMEPRDADFFKVGDEFSLVLHRIE